MNTEDFEGETPFKIFILVIAILVLGLVGMVTEAISTRCGNLIHRKLHDAFLQ